MLPEMIFWLLLDKMQSFYVFLFSRGGFKENKLSTFYNNLPSGLLLVSNGQDIS